MTDIQVMTQLAFRGECRPAFAHYKKVLGGRITVMNSFVDTRAPRVAAVKAEPVTKERVESAERTPMAKPDDPSTSAMPTGIVEMLRFAVELAYALEQKAKSDNWNANDHYSTTFYSTASQDAAYDECRATALIADDCADLVLEMEDALWLAMNRAPEPSQDTSVQVDHDAVPRVA